MTVETEKFRSSRSIFFRNSAFMLLMSAHFLALLKKLGRPSLQLRRSRVRETPLPSTDTLAWPTVGRWEVWQATYRAQASQWS